MQAGPTIELRLTERLILVAGRGLALSTREVALLGELVEHAGHVVTREALYAAAWGRAMRDSDRSVDVYVHRLRAKLGRIAPEWVFIHTHFGLGYRLAPERSQPFHSGVTSPQQAVAVPPSGSRP